jgi:hypothetical protein
MDGHNRLAHLAAKITKAQQDSRTAAERAAERAIAVGHMLIEAKALVKHGQWADWLHANVNMSERTARRYIQLARSGLKSVTVAEMGIRATLEHIAAGTGPLPVPPLKKELKIYPNEKRIEDFVYAFVTPCSNGGFHVGVMGLDHGTITKRPVKWEAVPLSITLNCDLFREDRWHWDMIDAGPGNVFRELVLANPLE